MSKSEEKEIIEQEGCSLSESEFNVELMRGIIAESKRSYAAGIQCGLSISALLISITALIMQLLR